MTPGEFLHSSMFISDQKPMQECIQYGLIKQYLVQRYFICYTTTKYSKSYFTHSIIHNTLQIMLNMYFKKKGQPGQHMLQHIDRFYPNVIQQSFSKILKCCPLCIRLQRFPVCRFHTTVCFKAVLFAAQQTSMARHKTQPECHCCTTVCP